MKKNVHGSGLVSVLLAISILAVLYYVITYVDEQKPDGPQDFIEEQGIDTSSYSKTLESTQQKLNDIQIQYQKQANQINERYGL